MSKPKKTRQSPIEAADLSEYLQSSDDFQFELDVFHSCLKEGVDVEHGGTYQDPTTGKDRQFDIRMRIIRGLGTIKLAIECKNLKTSFPLLVSRIPRRLTESFHQVIVSTRSRYQFSLKGEPSPGADTHQVDGTLFEPNQFVGKSTIQVGRAPGPGGELITDDSEVYEKWAQAIASAFDLVSASTTDYESVTGRAAFTVVFPVLVIADGTLWVADYSAQGVLLDGPKPSEECSIFIRKPIFTGPRGIDYLVSHMQVFTRTKFDRYLDQLVNGEYFDRIFPKSLEGIVAKLQ